MCGYLDITFYSVLFVILALLLCACCIAYLAKVHFTILKTFISVEIMCELDDLIDEKIKAINDTKQ